MQALQADQSTISGETSELNTLSGLFNSLQTALQAVDSGTGTSALQATVSDQSVATASVTGTPWPEPIRSRCWSRVSLQRHQRLCNYRYRSHHPEYQQQHHLHAHRRHNQLHRHPGRERFERPGCGHQLQRRAGAGGCHQYGTPEAPSYQLSLQSTALGNVPLQLNDGTTNLMGTLNQGADASYTVNGQPSGGITTDSATVTIAPGLNVTLGSVGTTTVTVTSSLSSVSSELSSFVSAYNAAFTELQKNFGQNGGTLVGDSAVLDMQQALQQMISYSGSSGSITNLAQLGVEFTQQGSLTFDSSAIAGLSQSQINDALTFLGNTNSGGFLQYANNSLDSVTDPTSGTIVSESQALQNQNTQDQTEITNDQAQLTLLQTNLNAQMAQANALIASLQSQNTFLQGLFQADTSNNPNASTAG